MVPGADDLIEFNFEIPATDIARSRCPILTHMYTRFPLSQHPFSILAKAAILESTALMHQLHPTTRMKLDHFLLFGPDPAAHRPRTPQLPLNQTLAELELVQALALQRELENEIFRDLAELLTIDDLAELECGDGALSPTITSPTITTPTTFALPPPARATPTPHKISHKRKRATSTSETLTHDTTNAMSLKERRQFLRPP